MSTPSGFRVWSPDLGIPEDEGDIVSADTPGDAAETWAETFDCDFDYAIRDRVTGVRIHVQTPEGVQVFAVYGEEHIVYRAYPPRDGDVPF